jgi:uncharacterized alpha-E superfamily protein
VLSRVAENVYWLARYLERAESTARLISVNTNLLLDLPAGYTPGWQPLIDITGSRAIFDSRDRRVDERSIVQFLIADSENPGSIASSLKMASDNARSLRDVLPTAAWELLNQFFHRFNEELPTALSKRTRFNFLKRIVLGSQTLTGAIEGTMNRNDAYTFLMLGRNLERADMTSRIADVRSAQLPPSDTPELRPFDTIQWMSVLKSLSGYQMYWLSRRTRICRADVLAFVLRDEQFPRACLYCLKQVERCLQTLPHNAAVLDALAAVCGFLSRAELGILEQFKLHELIDHLQLQINGVHSGLAQAYFPEPAGAGTLRPLERSEPPAGLLTWATPAPN